MDIVDFLEARLAEDRAVANAAALEAGALQVPDPNWRSSEHGYGVFSAGGTVAVGPSDYMEPAFAEHIVRWDPARVLTEIAAKQLMLGVVAQTRNAEHSQELRYGGDWQSGGSGLLLRLLVEPYADHPDYDPAWRVIPTE